MAPIFDFKDEQGRPRKPTPAESLAIQQYLNDQQPLDTSIPVRRTSMAQDDATLAAERGENLPPSGKPARSLETEFDPSQYFGTIGKGLDEIMKSQQRDVQIREQYAPRLEELRKAEEEEIKRQQANRPTLPEVPTHGPAPTRDQYVNPQTAKGLFAVASIIGALGMAGGRGRGMLAIAGLRGAMQGFNEGNAERYQAGLEQYKLQIEEQAKAYEEQYKNYMAILQSDKLTLEEKIRLYDLEASRMNDDLAKEASNRKDIDEMIKHTTDIARLQVDTLKAKNELAKLPHTERMAELAEETAKIRRDTALANLDKARQAAKDKAKNDKTVEHLRMAIATQQRSLDQLEKENKGFDPIDFIFGGGSKKQQRQDDIDKLRASIDGMQKQMNDIVQTGKIQDAVNNANTENSGLDVGPALELP